jgi:hypothetical protein
MFSTSQNPAEPVAPPEPEVVLLVVVPDVVALVVVLVDVPDVVALVVVPDVVALVVAPADPPIPPCPVPGFLDLPVPPVPVADPDSTS